MKRIVVVDLMAVIGVCLFLSAPALANSLSIGMRIDSLNLGIRIGEEPRLVVVPGTPVYEAPGLPYNYFYYHGGYYLYREGTWFWGASYNGPWTVISIERVPRPILMVPAGHYRERPEHWKRNGPPPWATARRHEQRYERGPEPRHERGRGDHD
jgi:hypothetical protein